MQNMKGNGKYKIDNNIRPNQGVFSINLDGFTGWKQDFWNIEGFDKMSELNHAKIIGITFEMMVPENFDDGGAFANIVVVLQAFGSWWMPLKEAPINDIERGKWHKIELMIEEKWLESMKSFLKIIIIFNSEGTLKGDIYIDNFGFIEKVEKK